jgi:hypothetical protein
MEKLTFEDKILLAEFCKLEFKSNRNDTTIFVNDGFGSIEFDPEEDLEDKVIIDMNKFVNKLTTFSPTGEVEWVRYVSAAESTVLTSGMSTVEAILGYVKKKKVIENLNRQGKQNDESL